MMKKTIFAAVAAMLSCVSPAYAGYVTENLAGLNAIYAQAGIYIKFDPIVTIVNPALVAIDTEAELDTLEGLGYRPPRNATFTKVSAFFVDSVNWCGVSSTNFLGCGEIGGPHLVVASFATDPATNPYGPFAPVNTFAHELGHTLGLSHAAQWDTGNLMAPYVQGTSPGFLSPSQIGTILSGVAKTLQTDADGKKFVEIVPYAVIASAIPEPATWTLMLVGFGAIGFAIRSKASRGSSPAALS